MNRGGQISPEAQPLSPTRAGAFASPPPTPASVGPVGRPIPWGASGAGLRRRPRPFPSAGRGRSGSTLLFRKHHPALPSAFPRGQVPFSAGESGEPSSFVTSYFSPLRAGTRAEWGDANCFCRDRRKLTQILRADAPLAGRKMLRAPPSPAEMDAPKEDTNSPGWVYKSGGGAG